MNYFELFNLPVAFFIDEKELKIKYIELSKKWHPDYHTLASTATKESTLDMSTVVNQAYRTLSDNTKRVAYILRLEGILENLENAELPQEFLMEMMDINERVFDLKLSGEFSKERAGILDEIGRIERDLSSTVEKDMKSFDRGGQDRETLNRIKDYYLKTRYISRIREQMSP